MNLAKEADPHQSKPVLRITRHLAAPPERVFRAWTEVEELARWFGPQGVSSRNVEVDLRPGGSYRLEFHGSEGFVASLSGSYREIKAPERLAFTWAWGEGDLAGIETLVTIELRAADGGTELTLTHEGVPTDSALEKHRTGWTSCLDSLEQYLAGGPAQT